MNIVLVAPAYPWRGGIAHSTALLYRHLAKQHNVRIITFSRLYPELLFPGTSQKETGLNPAAVTAEPLIDSLNPFSWIRAARRITSAKPEVVIFKYWHPFFALCYATIVSIIRLNTNSRILFICDNILPHEPFPGSRLLTRLAFRSIHSFIVLSSTVRNELLRLQPGAQYRLVAHPLYELFTGSMSKTAARKRLGITDSQVLLFFGLVRKYKGLDVLLKALPIILQHLNLRLLVVGEFYEDEDRYKEQLRRSGCEHAVTIVPDYIPADQVGLYFCACDAVVLPYRSATQSGIVQIAYQFDKPVITTDVGGLAEAVEHGSTGYVVPPENPNRLADAVLEFYKKKKEPEFVRNVRNVKRRFSWDAMVEAIEELCAP
jgi:glycosyltransferase involved in cell wall biosynthesis